MANKRILIVSKFYYPRGGDCIVAMNLEQILKENGHDVAVFAMQHPNNIETGWNQYFPSRVEMSGSLVGKFQAAMRVMGWDDVRKSFNRILADFKPDIVHLHNIHSYLSPIVAQLAKKHGCRVVWTLHDYKLVCPAYTCLRDGKPCGQCLGGSKMPVIRNRCMKGSLAASTMGWIEARKWNRQCLNKIVDAFVCPSQFIASKMNEDGFDESKLHVICNHIDSVKQQLFNSQSENRDNYYVYVGRLSTEKGVETLINVASKLPYALKIAGDGPLRLQLQVKYANNDNIEFLGQQNVEQVASLFSHARFSVVPSECWENNPLSVIESLCAGTPVVGANIGGIPELLDESNGLIFSAGNKDELTQSINKAFDKQWNVSAIEQQAINKFSHQRHLEQILDIYGKTQ